MARFNQGDRIRLKKEFWKEPVWTRGACSRRYRKSVSLLTGEYTVKEFLFGIYGRNITLAEDTGLLHVPADCFELVHPKTQITGVWFDECTDYSPAKPVDVCDTCVYKQYIERKRKQQEEWLAKHIALPDLDFTVTQAAKPIEPKAVLRVGMWAVPIVDLKQLSHDPAPYDKGVPFQIERIFNGAYSGDIFLTKDAGLRGIRLSYCKLLPDYSPMRKWTLEEIIEAQAFLGEFFTRDRCRLSYKDYAHSNRGEEIVITVDGKRGVARCCPVDDWNYYIGSMVALSKITGRRLPLWIQRGAK